MGQAQQTFMQPSFFKSFFFILKKLSPHIATATFKYFHFLIIHLDVKLKMKNETGPSLIKRHSRSIIFLNYIKALRRKTKR